MFTNITPKSSYFVRNEKILNNTKVPPAFSIGLKPLSDLIQKLTLKKLIPIQLSAI